jgi:hypothetical protein
MIAVRQRVWTLKQGRTSPWAVVQLAEYTDEQLVDYFLRVTHHWYEDKENLLFGWKDRVRAELLRCMRENDDANDPHQLIYAHMKFQLEWIGPQGMFEQVYK